MFKTQKSRLVAACVASIVLTSLVWVVPSRPLWTREMSPGSTPIGFNAAGHMVCVDGVVTDNFNLSPAQFMTKLGGPRNAASSMIRILDPQTGQVLSELAIPYQFKYRALVISDDWLVLPCDLRERQTFLGTHAVVIHAKTGELRFPPIRINPNTEMERSPDGRSLKLDTVSESGGMMIVHAETGQLLFPVTNNAGLFSSDSRYWVEVDGATIRVQSLIDGSLVATIPIPPLKGPAAGYAIQNDRDRLMIWYTPWIVDIPTDRVVSFRFDGKTLTDPQQPPGVIVNAIGASDSSYAGKIILSTALIDSIVRLWNQTGGRIPILNINRNVKPHQRWVLFNRVSGRRVGKGIDLASDDPLQSSDGRWLVEGGATLRVWKLPTSPWPVRWWTFLAAIAPWLVLGVLGKRPPAVAPAAQQCLPNTL